MELHGGTVTAESAGSGLGATFTVRLPHEPLPLLAAGPGLSLTHGDSDALRGSLRLRVLLVDDNVDAAELLAEILVSFGCELRVVHDGPAAIEAADAWHPDVALLDIGLPVMDGYELGRRLSSQSGLENLRLIALTGYGQQQDHQRSAEAGFHAHLVKPVDAALLRDTLLDLAPTPDVHAPG